MKYFDKNARTEVIEGVHFDDPDNLPTGVIELPDSNIFFQPLPEGKEIAYDKRGIPCGYHVAKSQEDIFNMMSSDEKSSFLRETRNRKIEEVQWRVQRARDEEALGLPRTEDYLKLLEYVQELRCLPEQLNYPEEVVWPTFLETF